ncbi:DUF4349 domain-containing protein [Nonomuraea jabiensis]|uniref:DUF4349 domain-containing protein n=1 Tax=Nonomuraea jabiensis TaxID=882448 RepID=A0A7W9LIG7_9ACTN|nr:DUF4349 domain-containing protein [Nonomuraea jabiensis]MBB5784933.1 hypothetical protein [Nonomuraea jabiensis]
MRRIRYGIALATACSALLLAGCGGGGSRSDVLTSDAGSGAAAPAVASAASAEAQEQDASKQPRPERQDSGGLVSNVKLAQQDRQVIYTGSMTVRAKQVTAAVQQAKQIVTSAGGYLSKEETSSASDTEDTAMLEFKVPPDKYAEVLARLGKDLGKQLSMNQGTQDVTMRMADVNSRLKSAQQSLDSLRTLLKKADTIGQVLQVEREISTREADLESLQAQQKELATQVAMATLTLRLVGPVTEVQDPEEEPAGFLGGLKAGWTALVSFTKVALTVLGALVPWLVASLPLIALIIYLARRNRVRRPRVPAPPPGPGPGPGPEAA